MAAGTVPTTSAAPGRPARGRRYREERRLTRVRVAALLVLGAVWVFPLVWMAMTALSTRADVAAGGLPSLARLSTETLTTTLASFPISRWAVNSVAIAVVAVALTVVVDLLAGYVLAKHRFRGRALVLLVVVATLMVPVQVLLLPQFELVAQLGWVNSYWAVIIPRSAEAFGVFLARQYLLAIPDELLEAAALDGAGRWRTFTSIVLPLAKPLVGVLVVLTFMYRWNEFAWPLVALRDPDLYTLPVGLAFLQGQYGTDYPTLMGAALLSALPVLALFVVAQRWFVAGLARSGLK
ncbi:carbohydrate ABC transporter permease [Pseudokineococcus lusitanus]|uniref:Carbohydrate ABC transporter membrane protein 2 (CUT1 family) n=1 Tax=Pseudokineococcus lusitanus TaxID=763993 RepID=A0A3N1HR06_9ACTN|nr:carbohydrate ABC transporter permease [Pseudokineococcus lusitanus]ROP44945.1 carbohydrate ABC transporter membrane protein 2 (CUT1 family) [Pseudokineococcus lusitanus]